MSDILKEILARFDVSHWKIKDIAEKVSGLPNLVKKVAEHDAFLHWLSEQNATLKRDIEQLTRLVFSRKLGLARVSLLAPACLATWAITCS